MSSPCAYVLLAALQIAAADQFAFPWKAFEYHGRDVQPQVGAALTEQVRVRVLQALSQANRDDALRQILPKERVVYVAGADWFDLRGIHVRAAELGANADFSRLCLDHVRFEVVNLSGANFIETLMRGTTFDRTALDGASFQNARLEDADFLNCTLKNTAFQGTHLQGKTSFRQCTLHAATFDYGTELTGVEFSGGVIEGTTFRKCNLAGARFVRVRLSDTSFLAGSDLSSAEFTESTLDKLDFTKADLRRARFDCAKFAGLCRLFRVRLSGAFLGDFDISRMDLAHVEWPDGQFMIGEEIRADDLWCSEKRASNLGEIRRLYEQAESVYRTLSEKYRQIGHTGEYLALRYRSFEARRKSLGLDSSGPWTLEYAWLSISKAVDGYGTRAWPLLGWLMASILVFAGIHAVGWLVFKQRWFLWYNTYPGGCELAAVVDEKFEEKSSVTLQGMWKKRKGVVPRVFVILRAAAVVLRLSTEATFMFAEKMVRLPQILSLFRLSEERAAAVRFAKPVVGVQAVLGIFFFALATRMVLLLVGG